MRYTFDTSTIISRRITDFPKEFVFSSVVLLEMMASANDDKQRRFYEGLARDHRNKGSFILPEADDWLLAGRILNSLSTRRRRLAGGEAPKLAQGRSQRMTLDALLATSAHRAQVTVVTENWDDFHDIKYYLRGFKVIRATEFFA
jgi:predicted nucleic acid-binding protein